MATRKQIQAAKKLLADTWRAANSAVNRHDVFSPSPGSFARYIAWCDRFKLDPGTAWVFDSYYQCKYIRGESRPSAAYPMSIEKIESLVGPISEHWEPPRERSEYEKDLIKGSMWAVLKAYEPCKIHKWDYDKHDYVEVEEKTKTYSRQILIQYRLSPGEHGMLSWEFSCQAHNHSWSTPAQATVSFRPGVASDLNKLFIEIVSLSDCRKISWDEEKKMTFGLVKYNYRSKKQRLRHRLKGKGRKI